ncbi:cell division protein DivIC [Gracilibacillus boraciitolerans JCM 21714]|uniref:Cell division protein DivIC n=1 Tax=Gracilibacillus boraciitolerans JCM 21714 TaxID=1298598 RepID=W4VQ69_9BACI|nr:cell division protein DivIC [Gracilibacillus boraciitolerans JCM 21714]
MERMLESEMERYQKETVSISIQNLTSDNYMVRLKDGIPETFQTIFPSSQPVASEHKTMITYDVFPQRRGKFLIDSLYLRFKSKLGLWERQITYNLPTEVKVIPNLSEAKRYLASAQNYLLHEGIKIRKMRSGGVGEFSKVRSYVVGDDPRKINWRQSAKLQEMMTNEYEPEHGKYVTILIDCGRMMGVELKEGNRLEKTIEAAITLATAALHNGDHIAVIAFSKEIKAVVPAGRGLEHLDIILQTIYAIQVDAQESNYALALQHAQSIQHKRSMMLLFSDVQTFVNEDHHLFYLKKLRKKHLFVMMGIEDQLLHQKIKMKPSNAILAMEKSVAQKQYLHQKQVMKKWEKHGLPMLEAPADRLAVTTVSHYIETLNRGML